jgi:2-amino-4-hydroxy-6-hydroxymethyldihydropteridine diphosphokinase
VKIQKGRRGRERIDHPVVESIIALGSNVGDREGSLRRALVTLAREMRVVDWSSVYETEPMYYEDQGAFLNCVVVVETDLKPMALLKLLKGIEEEMGRDQGGTRYGPRNIDMDILFYGREVVSEPSLEIPHPRIAERAFVLVPLHEVRPGLIHPVLQKTAAELLGDLKTQKKVVRRPDLLLDLASSLSPRRS